MNYKYLLYFTLIIFGIYLTKEGLCLPRQGYVKAYIDKAKWDALWSRIREKKTMTYAMLTKNEARLSVAMAAVADAITKASCIDFKESNSTETADIVAGIWSDDKNTCYVEYRGIDYTEIFGKCDQINNWILKKFLETQLSIDPSFLYPGYAEKGEIRLWFMEISEINNVFKCKCEDYKKDCEATKDACATDGLNIGKCIKYCGVCPYYIKHF